MKSKKIAVSFLALSMAFTNFTFTAVQAKENEEVTMPAINPTPEKVTKIGSGFTLTKDIHIIGSDLADEDAVNELKAFLEQQGFDVDGDDTAATTIMLGEEDDDIPEIESMQKELNIQDAADLKAEGYVLASKDNQILIEGKDVRGTYYGVKTLKQMIQSDGDNKVIPEVAINDQPVMKDRGIVEGFYGTPWTTEDRIDQMKFYGNEKLNLYIYAPKDDPYHRSKWREPYPEAEMAAMQKLINTANHNKVQFVFAISPGEDINFDGEAGAEDFQALLRKSQSMYDMGVRSFAIFFDDIADHSGVKQAELLNEFNKQFVQTKEDVTPLVTVPTEYWYSAMKQSGNKSPYTEDFSATLDPSIEVMWTGNEVVSQGVSIDDAKNASETYGGRKMDLWWNYPVTDYNTKKLALGPIDGFDSGISDYVSMLAINPMEFAQSSKICIATGADFSWNPDAYQEEASFERAVKALYGENGEDFLYFANHSTRVNNGRPDAPDMQALVDDFYDRVLNNEDVSEQSAQLREEFQKMKEVSIRLLKNLPLEQLKETRKQLVTFAEDANYAEEALQMIESLMKGDMDNWWNLKQSSLKHMDDMNKADAQVSFVVKDFIKQGHEKGNTLYENMIPKDVAEKIDYKGSADMPAQIYTEWWYNTKPYEPDNFAIDNTDKAYMSKDNVLKDSYVEIDLGKVMKLNSIYLLQGRTEVDDTVKGSFTYSTDGSKWVSIGNEYSDYETIVPDLQIEARYVRYTAKQDEDFVWFVRDFKVNKDIHNETATSTIKGLNGKVSRSIEQKGDEDATYAPVVKAEFNGKHQVKKGDVFTLTLREFKHIQNTTAEFKVKGVLEYTRNDVDWMEATASAMELHPIANKVRYRILEDGEIQNATLSVTNEERNPGTYTTNYKFSYSTSAANINNFDIASNAVDTTTKQGQYLQLDLGRMTNIRDLKLVFNEAYGGDRPNDVTFEYSSDGENWTTLPYNVYSWYNEYTNLNIDARYVKYTVNQTRGGTWTRIGEFSVNTAAMQVRWEADVNGQQPNHRLTNLDDRDLSTSYLPVDDVKAQDEIIYHFTKDQDLKRVHILQSANNITGANVIARTVDKKEINLGTLDKGYTILDMTEKKDVESLRIVFTKDVSKDDPNPIEIFEVTPQFYTLNDVKQEAEKAIAEAEQLLKQQKPADVTTALKEALANMKQLLKTSNDRKELNNALTELQSAMEAYRNAESETPVSVDKTALRKAIAKAEALNAKDYTTNSFNKLKTALAKAKKVDSDKNATQANVDEALKQLNSAILGLKPVTGNTNPGTPGDNKPGSDNKVPDTSDAMNSSLLWIGFMGALAGCIVLFKKRRNDRQTDM